MSRGSPRKSTDPAPVPGQADPQAQAAAFSEELYLRLNPDVLAAVAAGTFRSGRDHYERFGRAEARPTMAPANALRDRVIITADPDSLAEKPRAPAGNIDHIKLSAAGGIYVIGWINDSQDRLDSVDLYFSSWSISFSAANLARVRRPDAEASIGLLTPHACGFWGFLYAARRLP